MELGQQWFESFAKLQDEANSEEEFFEQIALLMQNRARADAVDLFLRTQGDILVLQSSTYTPEYAHRCRLGRGVGVCGQALVSNSTVYIGSGARVHPQNVPYPGVDERDHDALLAVPMRDRLSAPIGVCLFLRTPEWPLADDEIQAIEADVHLATLAILGFQNALRLGVQSSHMGAVSEVARSIGSSPYLEEILQLLVNMTAQQLGYTVCTVRLLDEQRGELVLRATQAPAKAYQRKAAIRLGQSIAGRAITMNRPVVVRDIYEDPEYIGHDLAAEQGLRSMVCLPLTVHERAVGVISCYTNEIHDFDDAELAALETIAKQAAYAIEHAKLQVRSTLMQEMHHRVKNNLQQVASLLRLQIRHGAYLSLEAALEDSLGRILAISAVHDLLSREDLDHVGLRTLVESLVQIQRESLISPDRSIRFEVRGHDVHLNTSQATQVALILNELVQNAIIHGYRHSTDGEIHVTIEDYGDDVGLWVSNQGDALPTPFDIAHHGHLGLRIVENLVRNLRGSFSIGDRLGWTVAEVTFQKASSE